MSRSWLTSPWLILLLLGVLLVVAVPVALYWWLNSDVDEGTVPRAGMQVQPAPVAAPAPAPAAASPAAAPPAAPLVPAPSADPAAGAPAGSAEAGAPAAPEVPAAPAASSVVHLEFGDESWTEIRDASGHMLLRKLNPAGSSVDVHGQPPFDVVIGNASRARMTYNGRPIDLKPFIDVTVARFTLEE